MKTNVKTFAILNNSRIANINLINIILLLLLTGLLTSCNSNDDNDQIFDQINDGEQLKERITQNRADNIQTFTLDGETGGEVYGEEGTILNFGPNVFTDALGNPVSGQIDIELMEVYGKAKMALTKLPTNGKRPDGTIETLKSGGEFFINATKDGEQLGLANGFMLFAPTTDLDPEMNLFIGTTEGCDETIEPCDVVWLEDQDTGIEPIQREGPDGAPVTGYGTFISNFGWTNIDRWYNDPRPKTILYVDVPEGFDNTNCNVYVSYDGEPTALALLDIYDPETELFSEHYGQIPIGLEVHFIFVSVQDNEYVYAIQSATIVDNHLEVIGSTSTATEAELIALINGLP